MTNLEPVAPADVLAAVRAPFAAMGATLVDVPVMQPLTQLLDLTGEAVRARLFTVQAGGVEEACLRPDFTIPVARAHIASGAASGRYLYEGKAFRIAPPGSDRAEEFLQIGVEAYGADGDVAAQDAEIAALAWRSAAAGGRGDLSMQLGDVSLFSAFVGGFGMAVSLRERLRRAFLRPRLLQAELDRADAPAEPQSVPGGEALPELLAKTDEVTAAKVLQEMWALAGIQPVGGRSTHEIAKRLVSRAQTGSGPTLGKSEADAIRRFLAISAEPTQALAEMAGQARAVGADLGPALAGWSRRIDALVQTGVAATAMRLSPAFGREFGYYDGFLFEVRSAALGEDRPVAAGGRYDGLLAQLGAPAGAAVGCMVRPWRAYAGGER